MLEFLSARIFGTGRRHWWPGLSFEHLTSRWAAISRVGDTRDSVNYQDALDYILSFTDYERRTAHGGRVVFDLVLMSALLRRLGNPHLGRPTIHIAGTKGKGSTAAIAASCLTEAGHRTGLFTSPHIRSFRERVRIGRELIPEREVVAGVARLRPEIEAVNRDFAPRAVSTFEIISALAFDYFRRAGAGAQVIEVGVGGEFDSTNVVKPDVAVITPISLEHTELLGTTVEAIAARKVGIVKPGARLVVGRQSPAAMAVVERRAAEVGIDPIRLGSELDWRLIDRSTDGQEFDLDTEAGTLRLRVPLLGAHQIDNAAVAVGAVQALAESGVDVGDDAIKRGVDLVKWPGRLQQIGRRPWVVVDGAHNADSAAKLRRGLEDHFDFERLHLVIGVSKDKDLEGLLRGLGPGIVTVIATEACHPRAMPEIELRRRIEQIGYPSSPAPDAAVALQRALAGAAPADLILVTGSLFLVADALDAWSQGVGGDSPASLSVAGG